MEKLILINEMASTKVEIERKWKNLTKLRVKSAHFKSEISRCACAWKGHHIFQQKLKAEKKCRTNNYSRVTYSTTYLLNVTYT